MSEGTGQGAVAWLRFYYLGLVETMSLLMKRKKAAAAE